MAISFPTLTEVVNKAKTGIKNALPSSNPFLRNSFLESIATMAAGRVYDFYFNLQKNVLPELFLTTAQDEDSIENLVIPFDLTKRPGTQSNGILIATGTLSTVIPIATDFQDSIGNTFTSLVAATIMNANVSITSLSQVGGITTAVSNDHRFFSGLSVTIVGAIQTEYNGTFDIIVVDENTFSYSVDVFAPSPATGTITGSALKADVSVESVEFGEAQNLSGGESLSITTPITNIDDTVFVAFPSLSGGTDLESNESLRERGLDRYINPSGNFTTGDVARAVKEDPANTRVFVQPITPDVGQVTVYFVRDNDGTGTAIIPDAAEITTARNNIIAIKSVTNDDVNDIFVLAPTPVIIDFTFSSITPATPEMQTAIDNSLTVFFQETVTLAQNITEIEYNSAIINTVDETGAKLTTFTLTNPSGDVTINSNELGIKGNVTF